MILSLRNVLQENELSGERVSAASRVAADVRQEPFLPRERSTMRSGTRNACEAFRVFSTSGVLL